MAPAKAEERVYQAGDRVMFCGWPSTVVWVNPPNRWWHKHEYHVTMDAKGYTHTTDLERTAIGVHSEELEPLCNEE